MGYMTTRRVADMLDAALLAGLGAGFGTVVFRALWTMTHPVHHAAADDHGLWAFVFEFGILAIFIASFARPVEEQLQELMHNAFGARHPAVFAVTRLSLLGLLLVLELLVHMVPTNRSIADIVIGIASVGLMTFAWAAGYRRFRQSATIVGAAAGLAIGVTYVLGVWVVRGGQLFDSATGSFVDFSLSQALAIGIGNALNYWIIVGAAGGVVLDLVRDVRTAIAWMMIAAAGAVEVVDIFIVGVSPVSLVLTLSTMVGWGIVLAVLPHFMRALGHVDAHPAEPDEPSLILD
jgi:hypothetical protein